MREWLAAMESYMTHQIYIQTKRFDDERRRMQHLEDMVHRVGDQLGAILTRAGTRMTAHEVNAVERLERLEWLMANLVDSVGEVCDHLGLEAHTLTRLQFHPSIAQRQPHTTWFGSHWPVQNIDAFLDQVAAQEGSPATVRPQVGDSEAPEMNGRETKEAIVASITPQNSQHTQSQTLSGSSQHAVHPRPQSLSHDNGDSQKRKTNGDDGNDTHHVKKSRVT
jgi:hypothetical protein